MIDQFINFIIRPPRSEYNPDQYLWEQEFTLAGKTYRRQDLELQNGRGHTLKCSHYIPSPFPESTPLPCVIYCHGNSGCRADANDVAVILLPSNITVFTLDFSGSGLSDGDYVSLGWHEKDDLRTVVSYLRSDPKNSCIGLWGRSMGAVTSLLYGAEDPSIAGIVLDSAFSNLFDLMMELVDVYKIRLPKFTVKVGVQLMRRVIQKKAKFDIMNLNCLQVAPKTFIPALFGHATGDIFIQPHHSDRIFESYAGDKNIIKFEGDHNSHRPQFYYDSVSIFLYNVLQPPQFSSARSSLLQNFCHLGNLEASAGKNERLCEITTDAASSSSVLPWLSNETVSATKSMGELLSESGDFTDIVDEANGQNEKCCSSSSSSRESWGRCSPIVQVSDESSSPADITGTASNRHQMSFRALVTPLRNIRRKLKDPPKEKMKSKKVKKRTPLILKKPMHGKLVNLDMLSKRFQLCVLRHVKHR
ncbi:uncharacterized protein LOC131256047 isoform X2 [Magnolia sinica]|uniref:uncharacterized protein LOC131256047 isoform X2 n=1 Tax=Magnolia sinica TaxID=86752 RepID=UPI00265AA70A|nr:uncharacterized protein LOC131256047 isoform X2 [Magnolia sinica]